MEGECHVVVDCQDRLKPDVSIALILKFKLVVNNQLALSTLSPRNMQAQMCQNPNLPLIETTSTTGLKFIGVLNLTYILLPPYPNKSGLDGCGDRGRSRISETN